MKERRRTALEEPFKALQELCSLAPKWGPLQGVPILGHENANAISIFSEKQSFALLFVEAADGLKAISWRNNIGLGEAQSNIISLVDFLEGP